ncbi:Ig-like domain-containing protein [Vibrio mediterranei]
MDAISSARYIRLKTWQSCLSIPLLFYAFPSFAQTYQCEGLPIWQAETAYSGGQKVVQQSMAYQANWWSQNVSPSENSGEWQEWSLLGQCNGQGGTNLPPSLKVLSPIEGASLTSGNLVAFEASASDSDGQIQEVRFLLQGELLGTVTTSPYSVSWLAQAGNYQLDVIAEDEQGAVTAVTRTFAVSNVENQPPQVTLSANTTNIALGENVLLSAQASDVDGVVSGVVFNVNGKMVADINAAPWEHQWQPAQAGDYIAVAIASDDQGAKSESQQISISVAPVSAAGRCSSALYYVVGSNYNQGTLVTHNNELFQCDVAGWCSSNASWAYEPGVGQHWQDAWTNLGACSSAPQVSFDSPQPGEIVLLGSDVSILASSSDEDGTVVSVEAFVAGVSLGELAQPPYQWAWNANLLNVVDLELLATDNDGLQTSVRQTVNVSDNIIVTSVTEPVSGSVVAVDKPVTVQAQANSLQSDVTQVELFVNGQSTAIDNVAPYVFSWIPPSVGTYQLNVVANDAQGNSVASDSIMVTAKSVVQPKHKLIGYWHNFVNGSGCPIPLNQMSKDWDIIDIAFADNDRNSNGTVHFNLYNGDIRSDCEPIDPVQFKQDIKALQTEGKIFVLSLGGAEGTITLNTDSDEAAFVSSLSAIIEEWGFDGLDIDLESGSNLVHGSQIQARLPRALRAIEANMVGDMYLTMAPEHPYVQGGMVAYSGIWGAYIPVIDQVRDMLDLLHVQLYNNGGLANPYTTGAAPEGSIDMMVAASKMLIEGFELADGSRFMPLRDDQVAIGLPSGPSSANSGQAPIANIEAALDCMVTKSRCDNVIPNNQSPNFGGVMTWSINWDQHDGFNFSKPVKAKLEQLNN